MIDAKELESQALSVPEKARAIKITSNETYQKAGEILVEIKGLRKQINATFDPIISKAFAVHKEAKAQKTRVEAPLAEAEGIIKPALAAWDTEQEQIRREAELAAQEAARKAEEDRKLTEAMAAEKAGDKKAVEQIMAEPVYVPPVVIAKTVPKVIGVSFAERWTFRVVNPAIVPREFLKLDEIKIGQFARAMKSAGKIPGIEIYSEKTVSGRG